VRLDCPEALAGELRTSLGEQFALVMQAMQARAPVDLRVNTLKSTAAAATVVLARDAVLVEAHPLARNALRVVQNPRSVGTSRAYTQGMVELQDVASQFVAEQAGAKPGMCVLDYCAGGGGKTLALAAAMEGRGRLLAHDANVGRMSDLPERARRAGARVEILTPEERMRQRPVCDLVLVDAPCSGTGAWRRKPDTKWRLAPANIDRFTALQDAILREAAGHVRPGGLLVYATCSLLERENRQRAQAFLEAHPGWRQVAERILSPLDGGDGFYFVKFRAPKPG
jgi:16S rRNA (cytosine967-C5)-methyltransferase